MITHRQTHTRDAIEASLQDIVTAVAALADQSIDIEFATKLVKQRADTIARETAKLRDENQRLRWK